MYEAKFELDEQACKFTHLNTTPELHGEKPEPAADLKFSLNMASADVLPMFDATLRAFLFCRHGQVQHDLADESADIPDLKFPKLTLPLKWDLQFDAKELRVHFGTGGKSDIIFPNAKVSDFQISPQQGGTVIVSFKARVHPDEKQFGKIAMLMGSDVTISLEPADAEKDEGDE